MSLKFYIIESNSQKTLFAIVLFTMTSHENLKFFFWDSQFQPKIANILLEKLPEFMGDEDRYVVDCFVIPILFLFALKY